MQSPDRLNRIEDKIDRMDGTLVKVVTLIEGIPERVRVLEDWKTKNEGRIEGGSWVWAKIMGFAGLVSAACAWLFEFLVK